MTRSGQPGSREDFVKDTGVEPQSSVAVPSVADSFMPGGHCHGRITVQEYSSREGLVKNTGPIRDRTALITQLRQSLYDYYPAALEAFDDRTLLAAWAYVIAFPTPAVTPNPNWPWRAPNSCNCSKRKSPNTVRKSAACSPNIPTQNCLAHCPALATKLLRVCWPKSVPTTARCFPNAQ